MNFFSIVKIGIVVSVPAFMVGAVAVTTIGAPPKQPRALISEEEAEHQCKKIAIPGIGTGKTVHLIGGGETGEPEHYKCPDDSTIPAYQ